MVCIAVVVSAAAADPAQQARVWTGRWKHPGDAVIRSKAKMVVFRALLASCSISSIAMFWCLLLLLYCAVANQMGSSATTDLFSSTFSRTCCLVEAEIIILVEAAGSSSRHMPSVGPKHRSIPADLSWIFLFLLRYMYLFLIAHWLNKCSCKSRVWPISYAFPKMYNK